MFPRFHPSLKSLVAGLALPVLVAGCAGDPSPSSPGSSAGTPSDLAGTGVEIRALGGRGPGLVPLGPDYRWTYAGEAVFDTGGEVLRIPRTETHTIIGTENRSGRDYWLLEKVIDEEGYGETIQWLRLRQDRSGLYEADVRLDEPPFDARVVANRGDVAAEAAWNRVAASIDAPARAAYRRAWEELIEKRAFIRSLAGDAVAAGFGRDRGGPADGELTRLAYPLHPGRDWIIREDPLFTSRVEAMEVLKLAPGRIPAWRVRVESELFGPDDEVFIWYGRAGYVGLRAHVEGVVTDEHGTIIGLLVMDDALFLTGFEITRPGGTQ